MKLICQNCWINLTLSLLGGEFSRMREFKKYSRVTLTCWTLKNHTYIPGWTHWWASGTAGSKWSVHQPFHHLVIQMQQKTIAVLITTNSKHIVDYWSRIDEVVFVQGSFYLQYWVFVRHSSPTDLVVYQFQNTAHRELLRNRRTLRISLWFSIPQVYLGGQTRWNNFKLRHYLVN